MKNEYLTSERSFMRKAREAVLSVKLEQSEDKDRILERYLNTVYFGRGAYGIEAAARGYFDVHASELDAGQAAFLVGLLRSPETADPSEDMEEAEARRASVVADMVDNGRAHRRTRPTPILATPIEASAQTAPASRRPLAWPRTSSSGCASRSSTRARRGRALRPWPARRHHPRPRRPARRRGGGGRGDDRSRGSGGGAGRPR